MIRTMDEKSDGDGPVERKLYCECEDAHTCKMSSPHNPSPRVIDESYRKFFLADPVTDAEVTATCASIYESMDRILCILEAGGVDVFKAFLQGIQSQSSDEKERSRSAALQDLDDATVRGSPRDYQTALLEIAKTRNTIIHLGTGKGKTLIALLCIRHFATPPGDVDLPKQTLFLVPSPRGATIDYTTSQLTVFRRHGLLECRTPVPSSASTCQHFSCDSWCHLRFVDALRRFVFLPKLQSGSPR